MLQRVRVPRSSSAASRPEAARSVPGGAARAVGNLGAALTPGAKPFDPLAHVVTSHRLPGRLAVLSVDVEHDYGGERTEALDRLPDLLAVLRRARLPLTAFVEGRLFAERPDLCGALVEAGADLQLHCCDHREPGDSAASLERGAAFFERFAGVRPRGYRARCWRLTEELCAALVAGGFAWDSSILPGIGLGNHRSRVFRRGDWFTIDDALVEFPAASWRTLGVPFIQSYRQLMGRSVESILDRAAALPNLLVYDLHMVDVVRDGRIRLAPDPLWLKAVVALARPGRRAFDDVAALGDRLRARGYEWTTLTRCHERLTGEARRPA